MLIHSLSAATSGSPLAALAEVDQHAAALTVDLLYLDRCQVDTSPVIVDLVWRQVLARRSTIDLVVDFGAGDGRFGVGGVFNRYLGYEIDASRFGQLPCGPLPAAAASSRDSQRVRYEETER